MLNIYSDGNMLYETGINMTPTCCKYFYWFNVVKDAGIEPVACIYITISCNIATGSLLAVNNVYVVPNSLSLNLLKLN